MKNQNLTLHTDIVADTKIIEQALYDILNQYNVNSRSGLRFIRISIIGDISIIIKMLNSFPQETSSSIFYVYFYSSETKQYVFSQAFQFGRNVEPPIYVQLTEFCRVVAKIVIDIVVAYKYKTTNFEITHNLDEETIPSLMYNEVNMPEQGYPDVQSKIAFIVDYLTTNLDIYSDSAMIELHYHINIDTEYETELRWSVYIQYSEIFYTDNYSVKFVHGDGYSTEYSMDVNNFTDYMYNILTFLYRVASYTLDNEEGEVKLYLVSGESIQHI